MHVLLYKTTWYCTGFVTWQYHLSSKTVEMVISLILDKN